MGVIEDLAIIHAAATVYQSNLCDRRVLFIPNDRIAPLEVIFKAENFMHLCGVTYPITRAEEFLRIASHGILQPELLEYKYDRNTDLKLRVLNTLMRIDVKASLFSLYPSLPGATNADCVTVNLNAVLGFVEQGALHIPDTVLNLERRWENPHMIIAVAKTEPLSNTYSILSKQPKGRKLTKDKIHRILASLNQYEGDGDITPIVEKFRTQATML